MSHFPLFPSPAVSIILPTYNRAGFLQRCISSVVAQSFPDWELIVVDDGSDDNTFAIVDPFVQQLPNVRYLKHRNRKLALSRNAGIQASFGRYITFIDSDDAIKQQHLQSRLDYMRAAPDVDLIQGGIEIFEDIWFADFFRPGEKIHIRDCVLGPTFFGKRHVFFELQGFRDLAYGEDTDFWARAEQRYTTRKIEHPETYVYTRADDSISRRFSS